MWEEIRYLELTKKFIYLPRNGRTYLYERTAIGHCELYDDDIKRCHYYADSKCVSCEEDCVWNKIYD